MRGFVTMCALTTIGIVGVGFLLAARDVEVYAPPSDYVVTRPVVAEGQMDRVTITARVHKRLDCEIERGDGPLWVDFYDGSESAPPPSAFFRPDGQPAGATVLKAGEAIVIEGYSAVVPYRLRGIIGTFVVRVPCQLWTKGPAGERVYGRKVVAAFGPIAVPPAGGTVTAINGMVVTSWESKS